MTLGPPFECAVAATVLGHPGSTVAHCAVLPHLPGVWEVVLVGGDLTVHTVFTVPVHDGRRVLAGTLATAAAFLRGADLGSITYREVAALLDVLGAWPPGWAGADQCLGPDGWPTVRHDPFALIVYRGVGPARARTMLRGTFTLDGDTLRLTEDRWDGGGWAPAR